MSIEHYSFVAFYTQFICAAVANGYRSWLDDDNEDIW